MTDQHSIEEFSENLRQEVLALAESEVDGMMLADAFTQTAFDMLSEAGEFEDPLVCYHQSRGMEVSGYQVDEEEGRVDVFLSIHTNAVPAETVTRQQVEVAFRRLHTFLEWCLNGGFIDLEESSPVFDMATHIYGHRTNLTQIRLCVLTDGRTTVETLPQDELGDVPVSRLLWDIVRLHRLSTSGRGAGDDLHRPSGGLRRPVALSSGRFHPGGVSCVSDAHTGPCVARNILRFRDPVAGAECQVLPAG